MSSSLFSTDTLEWKGKRKEPSPGFRPSGRKRGKKKRETK